MVGGKVAVQKSEQLRQLFGKIVHLPSLGPVAPQSESVKWAATGGAANPEIDPPGKQRMEHPEDLGDLKRAVVRQ